MAAASVLQLSWTTRLLTLGDVQTHVYVSPTGGTSAVEWSLGDVTAWVWKSGDSGSRLQKFAKQMDRIQSAYRTMYGQDMPAPMQLAQTKNKDPSRVTMYEKTVSTPVLASTLVALLTLPHFSPDVFHRAAEIVYGLLRRLCESHHAGTLNVPTLGMQQKRVKVNASGTLASSDVWSETIRPTLESSWQDSVSDTNLAWLRSTCQTMTIPEFILFCLNPAVLQKFSFLRIAGEQLMQQVLNLCTPACMLDLTDPSTLKRCQAVGSTVAVRRGLKVGAYFEACQMICRGEATRLFQSIFRTSHEKAEVFMRMLSLQPKAILLRTACERAGLPQIEGAAAKKSATDSSAGYTKASFCAATFAESCLAF